MKKKTQNYILFVILFFLGLFEAVSGFIMWLVLPRGGGGGQFRGSGGGEATFWSLSRNDWADLHSWVAMALVVMVIIHLVIHWKWIVYVTKSYFKEKA